LRGAAEANSEIFAIWQLRKQEIPRSARNRLRNLEYIDLYKNEIASLCSQ